MIEQKAYCARCNRGKGKGTWTQTEIINSYVDVIKVRGVHRKFMRGNCKVCGSRITKILKNKPTEEKEHEKSGIESKGI